MVFDSAYIGFYGANFIAKFRWESVFWCQWNPPWAPTGVKVQKVYFGHFKC